jgi:uncharacterized protein YndB with AHSA1/START domain
MGAPITSTIVIARPVSEVFEYILNFDTNGPEWATDVESVEKTSDGPVGSGTTFAQVQKVMGKQRHTTLKFVEVDPNRSIKAEAELGPLSPTVTLSVAQAGDGTQVTVSGDANPRGFFKLLSPIASRQGRRMWDTRLSSLKRVLEP